MLLMAACTPGILSVSLDNSPEAYFVDDARRIAEFRDLEMQFGRDRLLRIRLTGDGLWTSASLQWVGELEEAITALQGVQGVLGPRSRYLLTSEALWPPTDPVGWRAAAIGDPLMRKAGWISGDGESLTLLVGLYRLPDPTPTLDAITGILRQAPAGIAAGVTGLGEVSRAMDQGVIEFLTSLMPPMLIVGLLLVSVALRNLRQIVGTFFVMAVVQGVVLAAMGYSGASLNMVSVVIFPLLQVVTLATIIHVILCFRAQVMVDPGSALERTLRIKHWPVIWTGLTTVLAFGSLALSNVPPVAMLGLLAAAGFTLMTVAIFTLLPVLLIARKAPVSWDHRLARWGETLARWSVHHRSAVVSIFCLVALVGLAGLPGMRVNTNLVEYLAAHHPVRQTVKALEREGVGSASASIVVQGADRQSGNDFVDILADVGKELERIPGIVGVVSAADIATAIGPGGQTAGEAYAAMQEQRDLNDDLDRLLSRVLSEDEGVARLLVFMPMQSFDQAQPVLAQARTITHQAFPHAQVSVTGQYVLILAAQEDLLVTMLLSLGLAVGCIAVIFLVAHRSGRLALVALVPNLWALALVFGLMAWTGVPLDSTTTMIAAAVLGLAVDDSLHTLGYYRHFLVEKSPPDAAVSTMQSVAGAHTLTALVLASGFFICGLSDLAPITRFGVYAGAGILMALAADLMLMPALLASRRLKP